MNEPEASQAPAFWELKDRVSSKLRDKLNMSKLPKLPDPVLRSELRLVVERICDSEAPKLSRVERKLLIDQVLKELLP